MDEMKVVDMHCDTIMELYEASKKGVVKNLASNDLNIDIEKMKKGEYLAQCFAMFVPYTVENPFETCMEMIDRFYLELEANKDSIALALNYNDIIQNQKNNKISAILTIEEGGVTKNKLEFLRLFYKLGVRMITLTWNYENGVGFPNFTMPSDGEKPNFKNPNTKDGLTDYGIQMVQEMERLGMIIDVSHLSDAGFYDVLKYTKAPFVASHSNARSVTDHCRNLTDDMIEKLANRGGVTGINFASGFLNETADLSYVKDMVKHIKHIVSIGGIDCVGLGTDFDGISQNLEVKDASMMHMIEKALRQEGFREEDIEKIFYKNVLRVVKAVLK